MSIPVEGPPVGRLTRRLIDCPAAFLAEPRIGALGSLHIDTLVSDLLVDQGGTELDTIQATPFHSSSPAARNHLQLVAICCWLLHDAAFHGRLDAARVLPFLSNETASLALIVPAAEFIDEGDRREELARRCLRSLGLLPQGESENQAADRLSNLDSAERRRVLAASRAAEERASAVRKALQDKRAKEAATRYQPV